MDEVWLAMCDFGKGHWTNIYSGYFHSEQAALEAIAVWKRDLDTFPNPKWKYRAVKFVPAAPRPEEA